MANSEMFVTLTSVLLRVLCIYNICCNMRLSELQHVFAEVALPLLRAAGQNNQGRGHLLGARPNCFSSQRW